MFILRLDLFALWIQVYKYRVKAVNTFYRCSCKNITNKPVVSYLILSYFILSYLSLVYLILSHFILSYLNISFLIISYLSDLILFYLILGELCISSLIVQLVTGVSRCKKPELQIALSLYTTGTGTGTGTGNFISVNTSWIMNFFQPLTLDELIKSLEHDIKI